jgi:hypothetical protein
VRGKARPFTFALGAALLVGLSLVADDPLWTPGSSMLAACAAYWTAPRVFEAWVRQRRVTPSSIALWYAGAGLPFDITQLAVLGTWRIDLAGGNLVASTALLLAAGLVWSVDLRQPRHWAPAGAAAITGGLALLAWSWP